MKAGNRVALVTGGSRGIGAAVAKRLAADGNAVALTYSTGRDEAASVVREIEQRGGQAIALQLDLSQAADLRATFDEISARLGAPGIVVANAGDVRSRPIAESTREDFDAAFAVNARGALLTLAEAARRLPAGGRIIAFSTVLTRQVRPTMGLYAASKAAVEQFVRALAHEIGPKGITVNAVAPGPSDTRMVVPARRLEAPKQTPLGRLGAPEDIADVVAFLASENARWITGQIIHVNGGLA